MFTNTKEENTWQQPDQKSDEKWKKKSNKNDINHNTDSQSAIDFLHMSG